LSDTSWSPADRVYAVRRNWTCCNAPRNDDDDAFFVAIFTRSAYRPVFAIVIPVRDDRVSVAPTAE
jgi:hypothetical protein